MQEPCQNYLLAISMSYVPFNCAISALSAAKSGHGQVLPITLAVKRPVVRNKPYGK
jgi:hypothetical protein